MKIDSVKIQNYNIKPYKNADKNYKNSLYSTAINFSGKDVFVKNKQTFKNPLKKIMAVIMGFIIPAKFNIEKTDYASEEFKTLPPKEQREYLRRKFGSDSNFGEYNVNKIISKIKNNENLPLLYKLYNILPSVVEKNAAANIIFNAKEKDIESKIEIAKRLPQKDSTNFNYIILSEINNKNLPFAKQLMSDKRLERMDIAIILRNMENKDIDSKTEVFNILKNILPKNLPDNWSSVISCTNRINLPLAKKILTDEYKTFSLDFLVGLLQRTMKDVQDIPYKIKVFDVCQDAVKAGKTGKPIDLDIIEHTTKEDCFFIREMVQDGELSFKTIVKIVNSAFDGDDISAKQIIYSLVKNKFKSDELPLEEFKPVLCSVNAGNKNLAYKLLPDKNFTPSDIGGILKTTDKDSADVKIKVYDLLKKREDADDEMYVYAFKNIIDEANKDNKEYIEALNENDACSLSTMLKILKLSKKSSEISDMLILNPKRNFKIDSVMEILDAIGPLNKDLIKNLLNQNNSDIPERDFINFISTVSGYSGVKGIKYLSQCSNLNELYKSYNYQKELILKSPEHYINGSIDDYSQDDLTEECIKLMPRIMLASDIFDKETVNLILRRRFNDAGEFLSSLSDLHTSEMKYYKAINKNIDGTPLSSAQKIRMVELFNAYNNIGHFYDEYLEKAAKTGKIDISKYEKILFDKTIERIGLTEEELSTASKDKLNLWDLMYIYKLPSYTTVSDIVKAEILSDDFKKYLKQNDKYGESNIKTRDIFNKTKLKYNKWLNPDKSHEIRFVSNDKNEERLKQISEQVEEDITDLVNLFNKVFENSGRNPVIKTLINQYPKDIMLSLRTVSNQYSVHFLNNFKNSVFKMSEFLRNVTDTTQKGQFYNIWKRAQININNPDKRDLAKKTLTLLDHLNQRKNDLSDLDKPKENDDLDLTIRMWDRIPHKDLFQGNYSTCCIGMGSSNDEAMPDYIINTAFNMIELVDNHTGNVIGNALCYFVKNSHNEPVFVIDNIEINNNSKPSDAVGIQLRNAVVKYANNIAKDVTGLKNPKVILGTSYNDVPTSDLLMTKISASEFIGDLSCEDIYLDLYEGWIDSNKLKRTYLLDAFTVKTT